MSGKTGLLDRSVGKYFDLHLKLLSLIGLKLEIDLTNEANKISLKNKWHGYLINFLQLYYVVYQVVLIMDLMKKDNIDLATRTMSHMIANLFLLFKGYRIIYTAGELQILLRKISGLWNKYVISNENNKIFLKQADNILLFCKISVAICIVGGLEFYVPSFNAILFKILHPNSTFNYSTRIFFAKHPFEINNALTYSLIILEEIYLTYALCIFWILGDTGFAMLVTFISILVQILKYDIQNLIITQIPDEILKKDLVILIRRHRDLSRVCKRLEHIFSPAMFTTVLLSAINICFNVFMMEAQIAKKNYANAGGHFVLCGNNVFQIVIMCILAGNLSEQMSSVGDSVYACKWTENNHKYRFAFQMFILRCQKPFYCTAYGFFPIDQKRLSLTLKTSLTYYTMLRATK